MFTRTPRQQMDHEARHFKNDQAKFDAELETGFRCARLIVEAAQELGLSIHIIDDKVTVEGGHAPARLAKHMREWDDHLRLYLLNDGKPTTTLLMDENKLGFVPGQPFCQKIG